MKTKKLKQACFAGRTSTSSLALTFLSAGSCASSTGSEFS